MPPGDRDEPTTLQPASLPEQLNLFRLPPESPLPRTRHLQVGARIVAYELRTGRRRLTMTIDERGLRIGAPHLLPLAEIEGFVRSHADWVLRKLDEHAARTAPRHLAIRDGAVIPYLGGEAQVRVTAGGNRALWDGATLNLAARPGADLYVLARRGLQRRALELFGTRLAAIAAAAGMTVPPLALSSARTRWGSCSRHSGIRLNWRLIHLPAELIDYVIAHEAAHLVEMNHSPRFWAVVDRLHPEWRSTREELKRLGSRLPLI